MVPLDGYENISGKLLFEQGMLFDYAAGTLRRACPEDRLSRHCPCLVPAWNVSDVVKDMARDTIDLVKKLFLLGARLEAPAATGDVQVDLENAGSQEVQTLRK